MSSTEQDLTEARAFVDEVLDATKATIDMVEFVSGSPNPERASLMRGMVDHLGPMIVTHTLAATLRKAEAEVREAESSE